MLLDSEQVRLFVWVRDHEEDPVDITIYSVSTGGAESELNIVGGHLTTGLTTLREASGQPHELIWEAQDLPTDAIQLRIQIVDWNGAEGPEYTTAAFLLADGLPAP